MSSKSKKATNKKIKVSTKNASSTRTRLTTQVKAQKTKPVEPEDDHQDIDPSIDGQKYVLLSFLSEHQLAKQFTKNNSSQCSIHGLKIRGVFNDFEEAKKYSDKLQKLTNAKFHIYIGEVGKWLPFDPDPNAVKDSVYQENQLNELMKNYEKNAEYKNRLFDLRKDYLKNKNNTETDKGKEPSDLPKEDFSFKDPKELEANAQARC